MTTSTRHDQTKIAIWTHHESPWGEMFPDVGIRPSMHKPQAQHLRFCLIWEFRIFGVALFVPCELHTLAISASSHRSPGRIQNIVECFRISCESHFIICCGPSDTLIKQCEWSYLVKRSSPSKQTNKPRLNEKKSASLRPTIGHCLEIIIYFGPRSRKKLRKKNFFSPSPYHFYHIPVWAVFQPIAASFAIFHSSICINCVGTGKNW